MAEQGSLDRGITWCPEGCNVRGNESCSRLSGAWLSGEGASRGCLDKTMVLWEVEEDEDKVTVGVDPGWYEI